MKTLVGLVLILSFIFVLFSKEDFHEKEYLNVGYSSNIFTEVNINDAKAVSNILGNQLIDHKNYKKLKANTVIFDDVRQAIDLVNSNQLDIIGLSALDYLEASQKCNLEPVGISSTDNINSYEFIIVVNNEKQYKNINDLKDKNIVIGYRDQKLTRSWLDYLVYTKTSKNSEEYFSDIKILDKTQSALIQVLLGQKDAALVSKRFFEVSCSLNPQLKKKLKIIEVSPGFVLGLVCIRGNMEEGDFKRKTIGILLNLQNNKPGIQMLKLFMVNKMIEYKKEYMKSSELIYNFILEREQRLKIQKKKKR